MEVNTMSRLTRAGERTIAEPMIALARCAKQQRILVAGANSAKLMFELHRRGHVRVATTANCGLPAGQYDVVLVDWRQRSLKSLETMLDWLVVFLSSAGVLVVWIDPLASADNRKLRAMLEGHGLVVEAGTIREDGCAVSARRGDTRPLSKVA